MQIEFKSNFSKTLISPCVCFVCVDL